MTTILPFVFWWCMHTVVQCRPTFMCIIPVNYSSGVVHLVVDTN